MARRRQLELRLARKKRGRPKKTGSVSHRTRPSFESRLPQLVTVRLEKHVVNLRSRRTYRVIERAFWGAMNLTKARVCEFSIQGNHVHMLLEANDRRELTRAMQSFDIRLGKNLNKLMGSRGRVVAHRYHARSLRTPTEVRRARRYVRDNYARHASRRGAPVAPTFVDPYSSVVYVGLPAAETWLLRVGWQRGRPAKDEASAAESPH